MLEQGEHPVPIVGTGGTDQRGAAGWTGLARGALLPQYQQVAVYNPWFDTSAQTPARQHVSKTCRITRVTTQRGSEVHLVSRPTAGDRLPAELVVTDTEQ